MPATPSRSRLVNSPDTEPDLIRGNLRDNLATSVRRFAVAFLALEGIGAAAWWVGLIVSPAFRVYFTAAGAPAATLLAFGPGDVLLFVAGALMAAVGLARHAAWAWPVLLLHTGAAVYAGLYCLTLTVLTRGDAWAGAVLMAPSVVVTPALAWALRPREDRP